MDKANGLIKLHTFLLGSDPTPEQRPLYNSFPQRRGFSNEEQNTDLFVATFVTALSDTVSKTQVGGKNVCDQRVLLMIPRSLEVWGIAQIEAFLARVKLRKAHLSKHKILSQFVQSVKSVEMGTRVFTMQEPPKRWVAFGFSTSTAAPDWLRNSLLE